MVCPKCKQEHDGNYKYCDKCREKARERRRRKKERRAAAGLCILCGKRPPAPGRKSCKECLNAEKDTWKMLKAMHICVDCRIRTAAPNRVRCEMCLAKKAELMAIEHEDPLKKRKDLDRKKLSYARRKARGVCVICGNPREDPSKTRCRRCLIKDRKRQRDRWRKIHPIPRNERHEYELCYRCGQPALPGLHSCQKCKDDQLRSLSFGDEARFRQRQDIRWMNELIFRRGSDGNGRT